MLQNKMRVELLVSTADWREVETEQGTVDEEAREERRNVVVRKVQRVS